MFNIYKITNNVNGKVYIGRTYQNPSTRFRQHRLGMGYGKKMPIHLAMTKYGIENFSHEVIYVAFSEKDSKFAEIYFINYFNCLAPNGYNVDLNTKYIKDNPYLITETKESVAVQSIEVETANAEQNTSTRVRYPVELFLESKKLYESGVSPKQIVKQLQLNLASNSLVNKLKGLGCDTSNKARNKFRGNLKFFISESERASIISDFNNGVVVVDLVDKYKRSNQAIRRLLFKAGVYITRDKHICRTA